MNCPKCGYDLPHTNSSHGKRYRDAIEQRLMEYGYPAHMTPKKHQAATAIRNVLRIRYRIQNKAGGSMLCSEADRAIAALNEILPPKGEKACNS